MMQKFPFCKNKSAKVRLLISLQFPSHLALEYRNHADRHKQDEEDNFLWDCLETNVLLRLITEGYCFLCF